VIDCRPDSRESALRLHLLIRLADADSAMFPPPIGGVPVVMLAVRMLRDKHVEQFATFAKQLRHHGVPVGARLAGDSDPVNLTSFQQLQT
jgi:hypothetical protein